MSRRILLIGATGFFGERLARRLADLDGVELVLSSRDALRASRLADALAAARPGLLARGIAFDRKDAAAAERLKAIAPFLVIDVSGPFQDVTYDLARSALDAGAHWIDLADARDYVLGFQKALDALARERGLVARTGASSTPALSFAAVEDVTRGWRRLDSVDIAIMPGGAGTVGQAVIRAILHYAGRPISTFKEGAPATEIGWGALRLIETPNIGRRVVSPVETADADLIAGRFTVASRVSFAAGLESRLEQVSLRMLAGLRSSGLFSRLELMAPVLERARRITARFAKDRGGMTVDCAGLDADGRPIWTRWWLCAVSGQGPSVPVLPALALTRKLLAGGVPAGAEPATSVLSLADIEAEMPPGAISTSRHVVRSGTQGLLASTCDPKEYASLPQCLRQFHEGDGLPVWKGVADVDASRNPVAILIRKIFGFPPSGRGVPVTVTVDRKGADETWTRNFAGYHFASELSPKAPGVIAERFGPFQVLLGIELRDGQIFMPLAGARLGFVPFPNFLAPRSDTREFVDDQGRFNFDVAITLPPVGRLAHYRGWLEPAPGALAGGETANVTRLKPVPDARLS